MPLTHKTPLLDELEKGPFKSFVTDLKTGRDRRRKRDGQRPFRSTRTLL